MSKGRAPSGIGSQHEDQRRKSPRCARDDGLMSAGLARVAMCWLAARYPVRAGQQDSQGWCTEKRAMGESSVSLRKSDDIGSEKDPQIGKEKEQQALRP